MVDELTCRLLKRTFDIRQRKIQCSRRRLGGELLSQFCTAFNIKLDNHYTRPYKPTIDAGSSSELESSS